MPDSTRRRPGRPASRGASLAALGLVRVDDDFETEYPDGVATCTEAHASAIRLGQAAMHCLERAVMASLDVSIGVATALAVVDGAGEPLTPSQISDRTLVNSATMTATLDTLERRGWVRRMPNPDDRRSVLVEITTAGRDAADRLLPGIRVVERSVFEVLDAAERETLLDLMGKVLERIAHVEQETPTPMHGRRIRPARLATPAD